MAPAPRVLLVAALAGVAFLGLLLGTQTQREEFLQPDLASQEAELERGAAGNLIPLTGLLVAAGVAGVGVLLSRAGSKVRLAGGAALFGGTYLGVQAAQTAWPSVVAVVDTRSAILSTNLLAVNEPANPALWVPVLAAVAGILLLAGWGAARLLRTPDRGLPPPEALLRSFVGAACLAAPFLLVAAVGSLRLLLELPEPRPGLQPHLVVIPLLALDALGLLVTLLAQAWALGAFVRNGRLAAATEETWRGLGRAQAVLLAALAALSLLATLLEPLEAPGLQAGNTFGVTLRGFTQFLILLVVPMLPAILHHRRVLAGLEAHRRHTATLETGGAHPAVLALLAGTAAATVLAVAATLSAEGGLVAWVAATLPLAVVALTVAGPIAAAPALGLAAYVAWALGNSVEATFDGNLDAALHFTTSPGALALWRLLAAVLGAIAVGRLARRLGQRERPSTAVPLAVGIAVAAATIALVELPLSAWTVTRAAGESIGIGSLVASQDAPVRFLLHAVACLCAIAAALIAARLVRPEWFGRRRGPLPAAAQKPVPGPAA